MDLYPWSLMAPASPDNPMGQVLTAKQRKNQHGALCRQAGFQEGKHKTLRSVSSIDSSVRKSLVPDVE